MGRQYIGSYLLYLYYKMLDVYKINKNGRRISQSLFLYCFDFEQCKCIIVKID